MPKRQQERVTATREHLLFAAERLFAERGVHAVANRQISEAAGQGNNAAVTYHFGTKLDLIRAIVRRHAEPIERRRIELLTACADSLELRDWVECLVRPVTEHLDLLGSPSWYARFLAQVVADPGLHHVVVAESLGAEPALGQFVARISACLPAMPESRRHERVVMARHLIVQMSADRERALAAGAATFHPTWQATADALIEAVMALWQMPPPISPSMP